jgi:dTDP-4-amino-4,6-dideoxygalactose transaminase
MLEQDLEAIRAMARSRLPAEAQALMQRSIDELRAAGILVQVHYVPIYRHPLYADCGVSRADFPETERAYAGLLSLPLYPSLTEADQDRVVEEVAAAVTR